MLKLYNMEAKNRLSNLQAVEIPQDTAVNLANGRYGDHNAIELEYFKNEAYNGRLSKEEFKKLCINNINSRHTRRETHTSKFLYACLFRFFRQRSKFWLQMNLRFQLFYQQKFRIEK